MLQDLGRSRRWLDTQHVVWMPLVKLMQFYKGATLHDVLRLCLQEALDGAWEKYYSTKKVES